jgi:two-component system, chemotaxis family, chemotaxis protein CheY
MSATLDIFIIEDHADTRRALVRLLTAQGYRTQAADDGFEGLERLKKLTPRLIILDRMLPGMDGRQVLHHIRQMDRLKDVPVIDYSAGLEPYDPEEAHRLGVSGHITKAAGWENLLATIRKSIGPPQSD